MKYVYQLSILIIFSLSISIARADDTKEINQPRIEVGKLLKIKNVKYLMTAPNTSSKIFKKAINKIDNECCEEDYPDRKKVLEIQKILKECINSKCQNAMIPIFDPKKPPKKLIAFQSLENLEDLILGNQKFKYLKLSKSLDISRSEKLKNEKSTDVLKTNISDLENENKKLKKTVNKMLLNYENKIQQLEERNKILEDKFQKAYDMLPKYKKKDFEKE
mgnify:FL=1|tara:strand:+ start:564 stop:1220 length:657 start_codon:yes stop_codon:yes gene_type:complete